MSRLSLVLTFLVLAGCARPAPVVPHPEPEADGIPPPRLVVRQFPDEAFARGVAFLLKQQSADGAWRSDLVGPFKDGTALTPLVLCALHDAAAAGLDPAGAAAARAKAAAWLAGFAKPDGTIDPGPDGLEFPVYTAALSVRALSHPEHAAHRPARDAWLTFLLDRQLTEKHGWKPGDKPYGGWGYCRTIPRKPEPNAFAPPLLESNLSATVYALDALKAAGVTDPEVYAAAAAFARTCQNADGGFHFVYDDPVRNKAGSPDPPGSGGARFHSYGSTTADGLRALAACGVRGDEPGKARDWLARHFRADTHPGEYAPAHERTREAVYYYYAASVARSLREMGVKEAGRVDRAMELAAGLANRQQPDGSWANPIDLVREHDPLVATSHAVAALARCRP
jgi:hypothetical protein